jgi:uncharacterized protein (DUF952 family)
VRLFHITSERAWLDAQAVGEYRALSLSTEGFIHLSTEAQWPRTAQRFFRGQTGLVLLSMLQERLTAEVKFEPADGESFPHLYGALNLDAVTQAVPLRVEADGRIDP